MNEHDCPICRIQKPPKGPFRFRIIGRFTEKDLPEELGSAMRLIGAQEMIESFKKWPAIDPKSLSITDTGEPAQKDAPQKGTK